MNLVGRMMPIIGKYVWFVVSQHLGKKGAEIEKYLIALTMGYPFNLVQVEDAFERKTTCCLYSWLLVS